MLRKKIMAAAIGAMAFLPMSAEAVTVVAQNGTYNINYGDEFVGNVEAVGGAGSWAVEFDSLVDPLHGGATATIGGIVAGTFTNLVMSWVNATTMAVLSSTTVIPTSVSLATIFTVPNLNQKLVFSWDNSQAGVGFDFEVAAAVPLPAGGLLLVGALGGLAALRRRKSV